MRTTLAIALVATAFLPGCVGVVAYGQTRESARPLIQNVMAEARPDRSAEDAAGCVLKAMSIAETVQLGVSDTTVVTRAARAKVLEFAARPKAAACIAALPAAAAA